VFTRSCACACTDLTFSRPAAFSDSARVRAKGTATYDGGTRRFFARFCHCYGNIFQQSLKICIIIGPYDS
jgi:hypothetical protein